MPRKTRGKTSAKMVRAARSLRRESTPAETILWQALRGRRLNGLKFRRQHPIGPFVLDFFCVQHQLAIELDGGIHNRPDQAEYDKNRAQYLNNHDIQLLRIKNEEVETDLEAVRQKIIKVTFSNSPGSRMLDSPSLSWNEIQEREGMSRKG